jgi:high-affinity K+ transport system ATPase subunit B
MRKLKTAWLFFLSCFCSITAICQETNSVNGVADNRTHSYAFTNAKIVKDAQTTLQNATLIIKEGKIIAVGNNLSIPSDAIVIDCKGKTIYRRGNHVVLSTFLLRHNSPAIQKVLMAGTRQLSRKLMHQNFLYRMMLRLKRFVILALVPYLHLRKMV